MNVFLGVLMCCWSLDETIDAILMHTYHRGTVNKQKFVMLKQITANLERCAALCSAYRHSFISKAHLHDPDVDDICVKELECVGFSTTFQSCILYRQDVQVDDDTKAEMIQLYIKSIERDKVLPGKSRKTVFGMTCQQDTDCPYTNGYCLDKTCTCKLGYSSNPKNNTCVEKCSEYGSVFTRYPDQGIKECNVEIHDFTSVSACNDLCLGANFVCTNYEIGGDFEFSGFTIKKQKKCKLCNQTWSELEDEQKEKNLNYVLYYRHCKE